MSEKGRLIQEKVLPIYILKQEPVEGKVDSLEASEKRNEDPSA